MLRPCSTFTWVLVKLLLVPLPCTPLPVVANASSSNAIPTAASAQPGLSTPRLSSPGPPEASNASHTAPPARRPGPPGNTSGAPHADLHTAVIVETRATPALPVVILHMQEHLPNSTNFHVFHSSANLRLLHAKFGDQIRSGRMRLTDLALFNISKLTRYTSNWLYLNVAFWRGIAGENLLHFQCDTCICSKSRHTLAEFVGRYDYVGGPYGNPRRSRHQNGGFSLRSRSKMLEAIRRLKAAWNRNFTNEDIFFSDWAADAGIVRPAPTAVAKTFAVDSLFYDAPFATHKIFARLRQWRKAGRPVDRLLANCPEIQMVLRLNKGLAGAAKK